MTAQLGALLLVLVLHADVSTADLHDGYHHCHHTICLVLLLPCHELITVLSLCLHQHAQLALNCWTDALIHVSSSEWFHPADFDRCTA